MASYNKFYQFAADVCNGIHNLSTDTLELALTSVAPVATNSVLADLTEISYTNLSSRVLTIVSSTQTSGLYNLIVNDLVLTASGGAVAAFRYVAIYNNTAASKNLIAWFDYGSLLTLNNGDALTIDFDNINGVFTLQ